MAKKKRNENQHEQLGTRIADIEIVQFPLFPEEVEKIQAIKFSAEQVQEALCALVESGYEVVINQNTYSGGYSVCVRALWTATTNAGKAYYSNAPSVEMALQTAIFKHFTIANGGAWRTQSLATRPTLS